MENQEIPVRIPEELLRELKWLAEQMGAPPSDALRQAIATTSYLFEEVQKGGTILVKRKNGELVKPKLEMRMGNGEPKVTC